MKKTLLTLVCALVVSFTAYSQSVVNTIWLGHDSTNTPDLYWNFTTDSLRYSADNITYTTVSSYVEQVNIIRIVDISTVPGLCPSTDTGIYVKVFSNDTMWLNLFSDPCTDRRDYLTTHYFLDMTMNVQEQPAVSFTVYPNPTNSVCRIACESAVNHYSVFSIDGKQLVSRQVNSDNFSIDFSEYAPGIYVLAVANENGTGTRRIIVE